MSDELEIHEIRSVKALSLLGALRVHELLDNSKKEVHVEEMSCYNVL